MKSILITSFIFLHVKSILITTLDEFASFQKWFEFIEKNGSQIQNRMMIEHMQVLDKKLHHHICHQSMNEVDWNSITSLPFGT